MVIGFCTNTGDSVGCLMCKISHICESIRANYADFTDAELDACMEIMSHPVRGGWIEIARVH